MIEPDPFDPSATGILIEAPGRLHLGFLDPAATLGRRFGSVGLVIEGFAVELSLQHAAQDSADAAPGCEADLPRLAASLARLRAATGRTAPLALALKRSLPAHAGFGSGTQLALALGRAFCRLHGVQATTAQLAAWLGRGARSGIGIAGFDGGGLLFDGGRAPGAGPAPLLGRAALPPAWRIAVIEDRRRAGLAGPQEAEAIAALAPLSQALAADLCHQVLMRIWPGALEGDFEAFAQGVNRLQAVAGDHFSPAQGGSAWTSGAVGALAESLRGNPVRPQAAIGQSSWGPTGFAILPSEDAAREALERQPAAALDGLHVRIVSARDAGARVTAGAR